MPSEEDDDALLELKARIRRMAEATASRYARDDKIAMAEDLNAAGWIGYLSDHRSEQHLRLRKAEDFMRDAWVSWRFGVTAGNHRRDEPVQGVDLDILEAPGPALEGLVIARDLLGRLAMAVRRMQLEGAMGTLKAMVFEDGISRMPPETLKRFGVKQKFALFYRRRKIQDLFKQLLD